MRRKGHIRAVPGKRDVWRIVASFTDATGRRRRKWQTVRGSKRDAEAALAKLVAAAASGKLLAGAKRTVGHLADEWLANRRRSVRPKTQQEYAKKVSGYIQSTPFGGLAIERVTPLLVERYYDELQQRGGSGGRSLSAQTVRHVHRIIHGMFQLAVKRGYLDRNPAEFAEPPAVERYEGNALSVVEVRALLREADGHPVYMPVLLAVSCGLRRGEALALRWQDIDTERGLLSVNHSVNEKGVLQEPKTASSRRQVTIPAFAVRALEIHRGQQAELRIQMGRAYPVGNWVCTNETGEPLRPDTVTHWFSDLWQKAGVRACRFHDLRHTHSTLLVQAEHGIAQVSRRMGHAGINITADRYTHLATAEDRAAAEVLEELLG